MSIDFTGLGLLGTLAAINSVNKRVEKLNDKLNQLYSTPSTVDVIVYREGEYAVAVDGKTKEVIARSTDHANVLQSAFDHVGKNGGGRVFIKKGTYYLNRPIYLQRYADEQGQGDITHSLMVIEGESKDAVRLKANASMDALIIGRGFKTIIEKLTLDGNNLAKHGYYFDGSNLTQTVDRMVFRDIGILNTLEEGFYSAYLLAFHMKRVLSDTGIYVYVPGDFVILDNCHSGGSILTILAEIGIINGGVYRGIRLLGGNIRIRDVWLKESGTQYILHIEGSTTTAILEGINAKLYSGKNGIEIVSGIAREIVIKSSVIEMLGDNILVKQTGGTLTGNIVIENSHIIVNSSATKCYLAEILTSGYLRDKLVLKDVEIIHYGNLEYETTSNAGAIRGIRSTISDCSMSPCTLIQLPDEYLGAKKYKNKGVAVFSGDGSTTQFKIEHDLVAKPNKVIVTPLSADAKDFSYVEVDDTYIYFNFSTAPPSGTDNVKLSWYAEV